MKLYFQVTSGVIWKVQNDFRRDAAHLFETDKWASTDFDDSSRLASLFSNRLSKNLRGILPQ